jgi:hypothetical protein
MNDYKEIKAISKKEDWEEIFNQKNPLDDLKNLSTKGILTIIFCCFLMILSKFGIVLCFIGVIYYGISIFFKYQKYVAQRVHIDAYIEKATSYKNVSIKFENHNIRLDLDNDVFLYDLKDIRRIEKEELFIKLHFNPDNEMVLIPKKSISEEEFEYIYQRCIFYMQQM